MKPLESYKPLTIGPTITPDDMSWRISILHFAPSKLSCPYGTFLTCSFQGTACNQIGPSNACGSHKVLPSYITLTEGQTSSWNPNLLTTWPMIPAIWNTHTGHETEIRWLGSHIIASHWHRSMFMILITGLSGQVSVIYRLPPYSWNISECSSKQHTGMLMKTVLI